MEHHDWLEVEYFSAEEFRYPARMYPSVVFFADIIREGCGFPLIVTSDGRKDEDMRRIYGEPPWVNSPHWMDGTERGDGLCRAIDLQPESVGLEEWAFRFRFSKLVAVASNYYNAHLGIFRGEPIGVEIATRHIHIDVAATGLRRPHFWVGKSY